MRLWIEAAHQSLVKAGEEVCGNVVRTFQTEERFFAVLVDGSRGDARERGQVAPIADEIAAALKQGTPLETVIEATLAALPRDGRVPFSVFQVVGGERAHIVECDAPSLFLSRRGRLVILPVVERVSHGHLIRECEYLLQDGDHVAMISEGYLHPQGWGWNWADVAIAVQRLTDTNCSAAEFLGALVRTYRRLNPEAPRRDVTVVALRVRPARCATVWTGPPADRGQDPVALERLMAGQGTRIICGDTTAEIAARLLGVELAMEPRPDHGWLEVPPASILEGVDLVTEGLVTMGKARERMAGAEDTRDLPRQEDGATRLARALLWADRIHFIVGLAVNPAQTDESGSPLRRTVVEDLMEDLRVRGKAISVEYF